MPRDARTKPSRSVGRENIRGRENVERSRQRQNRTVGHEANAEEKHGKEGRRRVKPFSLECRDRTKANLRTRVLRKVIG